ncbi:MAG: hypothetical protein H6907_04125 [Hyphomicrobiales bacterium]|nr:hypothetical protein [Hyphomicrobiales bacterium]MCP5370898.1 hypothetical protein [Hyphomicrobiales bacterium]
MHGLFASCLRQVRADRRLRATVLVAAGGTALFFALHLANVLAGTRFDPDNLFLAAGFKDRAFSLTADNGYAEIFEYLLLALIILAFARLAMTLRRPTFAAFTFIFVYYLADDSLRIHEQTGRFLVRTLDLPAIGGLRGQDLGELATWAMVGVPLLGFLAWSLWRSSGRERAAGLVLTAWFFALAFFGGIVDMLSIMVRHDKYLHHVMAFLEDGGEMAVIVVIVALVLSLPGYLDPGGGPGDERP